MSEEWEGRQGASTRVAGARPGRRATMNQGERLVLRIDNGPGCNITPPAIATWLKHPIERVHVLLNRKCKTLSHTYAEMASPDAAKAALHALPVVARKLSRFGMNRFYCNRSGW
ncbi:uncharacterized protein LAESUDRAFT_711647 [Laetiporus sulphureus 93-53]|uniref:Uncharacterized protein n=1 Tax=Laetiporus sulphureus 93-53 TaxID=1314785 RepID=A0A165GKQ4_9APHY|nr:uncharacterized protein LAESUDRAFT_711647 [Laetiporus sulphureus 93-53]KZT10485.1 hypothetical protein LAESUDRAFT_711647 [Laetiporus sulphureus 93-53]